ncbi:MAG: efflux RND transporter periplasmic adaptor subunit [Nannocystaceae bacterium]
MKKLQVQWIAAAALLAACTSAPAAEPRPSVRVEDDAVFLLEESALRFESAPARRGEPLAYPPISGRVTAAPSRTSPSYAPLRGFVVESEVHLGDRVDAGQKLVKIQTAELPDLEHELKAARLAVKTREATVERVRQLVEARVGAENDLLLAESELAEARLAQRRASARSRSLALSRSSESSYWAVALRAGTIVQLEVTPGTQVGPDAPEPVATVADLDQVLVVADVLQRDAARLRAGSPATIRIPGATGSPIVGRIEVISEVVDPERQTVPVRVVVDNGDRQLRPGAFVDVELAPPADEQVVRVPRAAVVRDGARALVFVEVEAGVFRRRDVELGRQSADEAEIVAGLEAGERIVVRGALLLLNALILET